MLESILPEDLRHKIEGSSVETRKDTFSEVRGELYRRALEFGKDLYNSFLENPDIDYTSVLQLVSEEVGLSEHQRSLYADIVRLANEDFRHTYLVRELLEKKKKSLGKEALEQGLTSEGSDEDEVLGIIIYYGITGLWPEGKVTLVDENKLAIEIIVESVRDRAGIYDPKDIQGNNKDIIDPFSGIFRDNSTAFRLKFPLIVLSGKRGDRETIEKHEHRHHINAIVSKALNREFAHVEPLSKRFNDTSARLREIEGALTKGEVDMAVAREQYEEVLRGFMPTAFEYAKDELLAGYAEKYDINEQFLEIGADRTKRFDAGYDYYDFLYRRKGSSEYFYEKLPQELKDVLAEVKKEYARKIADQVEVADLAFDMLDTFYRNESESTLEGLLQTTPLMRWESEIKKIYGSKFIAYKEFKGFERRINFNEYFRSLDHEEPDEEREQILEDRSMIEFRLRNIIERMQVQVENGRSLEEVMAKERPELKRLEDDVDKMIRQSGS